MCSADCGLITGHSYVNSGAMLNSVYFIMNEGVTNINLKHSDILSGEHKRPLQQ